MAAMGVRSRSSEKGQLWHGYRRPILRDGAFWLSAVITLVALAAQNAWSGVGSAPAWILLVADVLVTAMITFALVGVLAGTARGFGEGWRAAESPTSQPRQPPAPAPAPSTTTSAEKPAPAAARPKADPTPDADRPVIGVELEKKARALGRAIGATQRKARKS